MPHVTTVNGARLYFEDSGGEGPVVVFSHGNLMDHDMWAPQVEALSGEFRCVTWPARTEVTSGGRRVALLTHGARTVVVPGPQRTFAENKRPFADNFQRTLPDVSLPVADREYWGDSPGGGSWSTLGPADTDYSVVPGAGVISLTTDFASRHATLRDADITDVDVRCVGRFDKVPTGQACSFALSFGYQDPHNNYRARLSFLTTGAVELRVEKEVSDTVTQLAPALSLATGVPAGTDWTIRVRHEGSRIQAKAWRAASAEPSEWAVDVTDPVFAKGRVGVRALANSGCTNLPVKLSVSNFEVDAANWEAPPTVTHGDWVRVLPQPFDGTWSDGLEQTIRAWAGSTAPDVLAHAAMFLGELEVWDSPNSAGVIIDALRAAKIAKDRGIGGP
ncbi:hypothetical protein ACWDAZ_37395, partial [Streptomyces sp. NPDC001215]